MDGDASSWTRKDGHAQAQPIDVRLSDASRGDRGVVLEVSQAGRGSGGIEASELERRLLEMGFIEGARVEVLHEGFIGRDPIAVKLDDMRVALRRREAFGILLRLDHSSRSKRGDRKA